MIDNILLEISEDASIYIDEIYNISLKSLNNSWKKESYIQDINNILSKYFLLKYRNQIIGFLSVWIIVDEINITNIAIHPNFRGYGLSKILLNHIMLKYPFFNIFLEVRESNIIALNLYKSLNFQILSTRPNYYENPKENAIIMIKKP